VDAVTLSKTKKKPGLERKGKVVAEIKDAVDQYSSAYVFTYDNMRNQKLKDLREQLKSSSRYPPLASCRIFLSKCYIGPWTPTNFSSGLDIIHFTVLHFQAVFNVAQLIHINKLCYATT
jgi:hypothetical protein